MKGSIRGSRDVRCKRANEDENPYQQRCPCKLREPMLTPSVAVSEWSEPVGITQRRTLLIRWIASNGFCGGVMKACGGHVPLLATLWDKAAMIVARSPVFAAMLPLARLESATVELSRRCHQTSPRAITCVQCRRLSQRSDSMIVPDSEKDQVAMIRRGSSTCKFFKLGLHDPFIHQTKRENARCVIAGKVNSVTAAATRRRS